MNCAILCEGTPEPLHRQLRGTLYHEITQILQEDYRMRRFLLEFLHFHTYFLHAWTDQSAHLLHDFITKSTFGNSKLASSNILVIHTDSTTFQTVSVARGISAAELSPPADYGRARVPARRGARPALVPDGAHPPPSFEMRAAGVALGRTRGRPVKGELGAGEHHDALRVVRLSRRVAAGKETQCGSD